VKLDKELNDRAFNAIKDGEKSVEIRANKARFKQPSFNTAKPNDLVRFTNTETQRTMLCEIQRITLYRSVRDLLESEGTKETLSSTDDLQEGIESIHGIPGYKDYIEDNGVFAVHLSPPKEVIGDHITELMELANRKQGINKTRSNQGGWTEKPSTYLKCMKEEIEEVQTAIEERDGVREEMGDILWDYLNIIELLDEDITIGEILADMLRKYNVRVNGLEEGKSWSETK